MCIILNIIPNVYWVYNNPNKVLQKNEYNIELQRYSETFNIKTMLDLDEKLSFWHNSRQYINEIKVEMEKNEFSKLYAILQKTLEIIKTSYITNSTIIISTYSQNHIELGLAIWIYFFNINANMAFNDVIKLMAYKIIVNITMSDELKKFFAFLNIKHLSDKS